MSAADLAAKSDKTPLSIATGCAIAIGISLLAIQYLIALLAERFHYDVDFSRAPIAVYVGLFMVAGLIYLPLAWLIPRLPPSRYLLITIIVIGLLLRLLMFASNPILEIDFYRYLWDGAVLANGFNPYALPPAQVPGSEISFLAKQAGPVFDRINYRELSSIYPPLAQALFALAHWFDPWQADGLRLLWLLADSATLLMIFKMLKRLDRSPLWICLYWWSPLLVTLSYNSLHMDILLLPLLMAALWWMLERRPISACSALTLAASIKLWPLLLLPFALRCLYRQPRQLLGAVAVILLIAGIGILPMLLLATTDHSGLLAFSQHWQRNTALFPQLVNLLSLFVVPAEMYARLLVALSLSLLVIYLVRTNDLEAATLIRRITITIALLFLLSPVQLPWYYLWLLPFLSMYPHPALLLMASLLPIYFLRFHFDFRGEAHIFDQFIVWFQYLPALLLMSRQLPDRRPGPYQQPVPSPGHV